MGEIEDFKFVFNRESLHFQIYDYLYKFEGNARLKKELKFLLGLERKHVAAWGNVLKSLDASVPPKNYFFYPRIARALRLVIGASLTARAINAYENLGVLKYLGLLDKVPRANMKEVVNALTEELYSEKVGIVESTGIMQQIRDIVFGMNDGLVEILASVAGLASFIGNNVVVAIAGVIVGVSGTLSMAVGAYLSSGSEKDVMTSENKRLQLEIEVARRRAEKELGRHYTLYSSIDKNITELIAKLKAKNDPIYKLLEREKTHALFRFLRKNEKRIFEDRSGSSPLKDAAYVGVFYFLGAFVPVLGFIIGALLGTRVLDSLIISLVLTSFAIVITATLIAINTDKSIIKKVSQYLTLSLGASAITFFIGNVLSNSLHIVI